MSNRSIFVFNVAEERLMVYTYMLYRYVRYGWMTEKRARKFVCSFSKKKKKKKNAGKMNFIEECKN